MLTVAKITATGGAHYAEYLEGKTRSSQLGDYYLQDGERVEAPGRWVRMSAALGATGDPRVSGETLRELLAVRYPGRDVPLRRVGASGEAVAAIDATFSAPKSVSAVWALGDEELRHEIEVAHERAINRAVGHAMEYVPMVRQRVDAETVARVPARDVVATSWRHTTARAVDGQLPDPQLHSHVLLHAGIRQDGQVVAIESRAWMQHRREIGAAYRAELAREMHALGFAIQRGTGRAGAYFEIEGVPRELRDLWSNRTREIEAKLRAELAQREVWDLNRRWDVLSPRQDRQLRVLTRAAKQPATRGDLDRAWRDAARETGFGPEAAGELRSPDCEAMAPVEREDLVRGLTDFKATFHDREARAVALERSAGAAIGSGLEVLAAAKERGEVLALADGTHTTAQHRALERSVLAAAQGINQQPAEPVSASGVVAARQQVNTSLAPHGGQLSPEQERALELATGSQRLVMIEGQAGTGKSTTLQAVALAHQAQGHRIFVTSTGALAAQRLAADLSVAGVNADAHSSAALKHELDSGALTLDDKSVVIHDEAALASTREQHDLMSAVNASGARLILVGDPEQSKPVGAGGLWTHLENQLAATARAELSVNLRAKDPHDRRDQKRFRDGEHKEALTGFLARERLWLQPDREDAEDFALLLADGDRQAGKSTIVIAQTSNEHLDELNAQAQAIRIRHGQLGGTAMSVPGRPYVIYPGDQVQIRHGITLPDHGPLRNGTEATVLNVSPDVECVALKLADGQTVALDAKQVAESDLRLAYVQHPFPAQGMTTDTAHLIVSEHATREGSYVAITRARQQTHIYADRSALQVPNRTPLQQLAEVMGRDEPEAPSISLPLAQEQAVTERLGSPSPREPESPRLTPPLRQPQTGVFAQRLQQIKNARQAGQEVEARQHNGPALEL